MAKLKLERGFASQMINLRKTYWLDFVHIWIKFKLDYPNKHLNPLFYLLLHEIKQTDRLEYFFSFDLQ